MAGTMRATLFRSLHEKGLTYEEIGELFDMSRQAAWEIANKSNDGFRVSTIKKIKYKGLREWMLKNRVNLCELERLCGGMKFATLTRTTYNPSKKNIDAILSVTGLTYEECFKEESEQYD